MAKVYGSAMSTVRSAAVALAAAAALVPAASAGTTVATPTVRAVARQAVAGIEHDVTGETSVFGCRSHGIHAACEVQVFGAYATLRARVIETFTAIAVHTRVVRLKIVQEPSPDPAG